MHIRCAGSAFYYDFDMEILQPFQSMNYFNVFINFSKTHSTNYFYIFTSSDVHEFDYRQCKV